MLFITVIVAIFSGILSSTLTPSLTIWSGALDFNLILLLLFLFYANVSEASVFLLVSSIAVAALSGVPLIYVILPGFLLTALYIFLSDRRILPPRPTVSLSILLFFLASIFVSAVKVLLFKSYSTSVIVPTIMSAVLTAFVGSIIYYFCNRVFNRLNPQVKRQKIKISRFN